MCGATQSVLRNKLLGIKCIAKRCAYGGVVVPTAFYRADTWGMRCAERTTLNILGAECLTSLVGISRIDRVRNDDVHIRIWIEIEISNRVIQSIEMVLTRGKNG